MDMAPPTTLSLSNFRVHLHTHKETVINTTRKPKEFFFTKPDLSISPFSGKVISHRQLRADENIVKVNVPGHCPQLKADGSDGEKTVEWVVIFKVGGVSDPFWLPNTLRGDRERDKENTTIIQNFRYV